MWWALFSFCPLQNESELFGRTIRVNLAKPMRIKEGSSRPGELVPWQGEIPRDVQSLVHQPFCFPNTLPPIQALGQPEQHPDHQKYPLVPRADVLLAVLPAALTLSNRAHEMHAHMPGWTSLPECLVTSKTCRGPRLCPAMPARGVWQREAIRLALPGGIAGSVPYFFMCWGTCPLPWLAVPAACSCALAVIPLLPEPHQALSRVSHVAVGFVTLHQLFPRLSQSGRMTNG